MATPVIIKTSVKGDKPVNQDAIRTYEDSNLVILALADGLGSSRHSEVGSSLICRSIVREVKKAYNDHRGLSPVDVLKYWYSFVTNRGYSPIDCQTTSSFVIINKDKKKVTTGAIGDSRIIIRIDGKLIESEGEKDFLNETDCIGGCHIPVYETSSFTYTDALEVVIASDGICDEIECGAEGAFIDYLEEKYRPISSCQRNRALNREVKSVFGNRNNDDKSIIALWTV